MTSDKDEDADIPYNMDSPKSPIFLLISQKEFDASSSCYEKPWKGTQKNEEALEKLFTELGFVVEKYENQTLVQIRNIFKDVETNEKYKNVSCFVCAILSHGKDGGFIAGYDKPVQITHLFNDVSKAKHLVGKPKFFIIQACRGSERMEHITRAEAGDDGEQLTLPIHADFLYAYSSPPGFISFIKSNGGWFIQKLVSIFQEKAEKMDVLKMLTRVNFKPADRRLKSAEG